MVRVSLPADPVTTRALDIAVAAHIGQFDKSGVPYIEHPLRVASKVHESGYGPVFVAAALLHDVVEDTELTLGDLSEFPQEVVSAVDALSRRESEKVEDYYARVRTSSVALVVKRFDIEDNSDPARLILLDEPTRVRLEKKYEKALSILFPFGF